MTKAPSKAALRSFGDAVRAHRQRVGMSQEQLAASAGLDRTYIGGVERGERNLGLVNVLRIAHALGVRPEVLFTDIKA